MGNGKDLADRIDISEELDFPEDRCQTLQQFPLESKMRSGYNVGVTMMKNGLHAVRVIS